MLSRSFLNSPLNDPKAIQILGEAMNVIALCISFILVLLIGCSEDKPAEVSATSSTVLIDFNPDEFPEEPPEVESKGGYSSLAALIESQNATPTRVREVLELGADVMELGKEGGLRCTGQRPTAGIQK